MRFMVVLLAGCVATCPAGDPPDAEMAELLAAVPAAWLAVGLPDTPCLALLDDPRLIWAPPEDFRALCGGCGPYDWQMLPECERPPTPEEDPLYGACVLPDGCWVIHSIDAPPVFPRRVAHAGIRAVAMCADLEDDPRTHPWGQHSVLALARATVEDR